MSERPYRYSALDYANLAYAGFRAYQRASHNVQKDNIANDQMAKYKYKYKNQKKSKPKKKGIIKRYIPRTLQPATKMIRCIASQQLSLTVGGAGLMSMVPIQANSVLDPFLSNGTGRPLGFDEWSSLYRTAYVLGCKVKTTWWNNTATALVVGVSFPGKQAGTTSLADYEYYRETPRTHSRIFSPDVDHGVVTNKCSTKKVLDLKNITDNDTVRVNLQTPSEPTENHYAHVWMQAMDHASTPTSVPVIIDVEYIVLLTNPVIPARSTE